MLDASIAPSAAPAPIMVCISSINKITSPDFLISSITFFSRSSNSPRYFAPATMAARSRVTTLLSLSISGIFPSTILWAKPSTTAVLPTPGSPIRQGLFLVLLLSTCITRSISSSLPTTGSSLFSDASSVRCLPNLSKVGVALGLKPPGFTSPIPCSLSLFITCCLALFKSTFNSVSILAATPSPSLISPSNKCSVPI